MKETQAAMKAFRENPIHDTKKVKQIAFLTGFFFIDFLKNGRKDFF